MSWRQGCDGRRLGTPSSSLFEPLCHTKEELTENRNCIVVKTVQLHESGFSNGCKKMLALIICNARIFFFKGKAYLEKKKNVKLNVQLPDIKKQHRNRSVAAPLKQSRK
jgi:hypothetical protein